MQSCFKLYLQTIVLLLLIMTSVFILSLSTIGRDKRQRLAQLLQMAEENDLCQALDLTWEVDSKNFQKDYQCEYHDIETVDGYLLRLKRVYPSKINPLKTSPGPGQFKFNVLLVPGLGDSSSTFAMSGRKQSLVGTLLDMNETQIWLLDPRGRSPLIHRNFTGDQHEFWDFSFDEKVEFDLPSSIDYILRLTNRKQIDAIVGHSQGGLLSLAYLTATTGTQQKVATAYFYAPPLAGWNPSYASIREGLIYPVAHHLLPNKNVAQVSNQLRQFLSFVCLAFPRFCLLATCLVAGCGKQSDLNPHKLSEILTFYPSATSLKNVEHLFQCERQAGLIRNYLKGNHFVVENFNQLTNVSLSFYFGQNDRLVDKRRYNQGLKLLNPLAVKRYRVFDYGHADFVWGENARRLVYQDIVDDLLLL